MAKVALVCGAAGVVGSYTALALKSNGWNVVGAGRSARPHSGKSLANLTFIQADFSSREVAEQIVLQSQPSLIVFAAGPANVQQSIKDPADDFERQTLPLVNVLGAAARMQVHPRFILVSSAAVYGNPDILPTPESTTLRPISPYGYHKVIQELLVDEYRQLYGLPVVKARVFSVFGPGLRHLAIWEIAKRAIANDYSLRGLGDESRDYLHLADVASALLCIANSAAFTGEAINVASGVETTVSSVAQMIFESLGLCGQAEFDGLDLTGSPRRWCADTSLLRSLGFKQRVTVRNGIEETIQWIENNA